MQAQHGIEPVSRNHFHRLTHLESALYAGRLIGWAVAALLACLLIGWLLYVFSPNRPRDYADDRAHFFYGSIGSDISGGLPLKVMQVLPKIFADYLPRSATAKDYTAFGFIQESGRPMPIGFSIRRQIIDRTALNCAACHAGVVRNAADATPMVVPGMPAQTVNLLAFFEFLFRCAADDDRFTADTIVAAMEAEGLADPLDGPIYRFVVPAMKEALLLRARKLRFVTDPEYTDFGPGRVNTFDTFKFEQFAYYYKAHGRTVGKDEIYGIADFPSIWNQMPRADMQLHWDGNNSSLRERNFSAALGAGARPEDMDLPRLYRTEAWLTTLPPPAWPFEIDPARSDRGKEIYGRLCAGCHDFGGKRVGKVVPIADIGTDRSRLDSYTPFLREAQIHYTRNVPWTFSHFTKTDGYAAHPLDGIWARAPYLHNGSVPTLWDLLSPAKDRPIAFTSGGTVYDPRKMGFEHAIPAPRPDSDRTAGERPNAGTGFVFDTTKRGNGKDGHTGAGYGTNLSDDEKWALIEYLKTK